jgi:fused signal recognition particle receptor
MLGAADTFRATAVEQLQLWADRVGVPIVQQGMNADPASVAYDTLQSAISKGMDVVLIDTAGRLHNKIGLMNELGKIKKVMQKLLPDAPHEVLLVLDASTGQNAIEQAKQFTAATDVNALALTKLDGTAKGGVIIGISDQFQIPVRYIGLGEKMTDLQVFNADEFVDSLFEKGESTSSPSDAAKIPSILKTSPDIFLKLDTTSISTVNRTTATLSSSTPVVSLAMPRKNLSTPC